MSKAAVRVYIEAKQKRPKSRDNPLSHERVLVLDTETTNDEYQNLLFGSFRAYFQGNLEHLGIFYNPKCVSEKELKNLKSYTKKHSIPLYTLEEFVEDIFFPQVHQLKTLCIGFNLPFDLSRLAIRYSYARGSMNGGFSFQLSENMAFPRIKIKHLDSTKAFIRFGSSLMGSFSGHFLDLKTLAVTLTDDKHITLDKACKIFKTKHRKLKEIKHGKITEKYIEYNLLDTKVSYELYLKMKEELKKYQIKIPITEIYSSASLGKACLGQLGIKAFFNLNPKFPPKIMGFLMASYYGGRSEVKIRKTPTKVTIIDFLSMYPTMFILMGLWDLLTAEKIEYVDDTESVRTLLNEITLEDLRRPEIWKQLNVIVKIQPKGDIFPVRMKYGNRYTYNIGVNQVISAIPFWYTLADTIASKLLAGVPPRIIKAIRFVPKGKQSSLKESEILGVKIYPRNQNLFKVIIEERERCKRRKEGFRQKALKILANSTSYGIFVEMNEESLKKEKEVKVFSNTQFKTKVKKLEEPGRYFNPIIAVMITGGARLVLAIVEAILKNHEEVHAFCDTDSMAVPTNRVKEIQNFFEPLNPYDFERPLFKVEKRDVWLYGISAKRYVVYRKKGKKFLIDDGKDRGYSLHGLGHLTNPFGKNIENWHKKVWEDILNLHYGYITKEQFFNKYSNLFAISEFSASTYELLKRFRKINDGKTYEQQIKPFNFFLVGVSNDNSIKPVSPYSDNPQETVHTKFVDYNSGEVFEGLEYWKSLMDTFSDYIEHPESKLEDGIGVLDRKSIWVKDPIHIGKETNSMEETEALENLQLKQINKKRSKIRV